MNPTGAEDSSVNFECGFCIDRKLESITALQGSTAALQFQVSASLKPVNKPVFDVGKIGQSM